MLAQLSSRLAAMQLRLGRVDGFGSNAWAVNRTGTPDGIAVIASDGHLPLTSPALFYQIGLDTTVLGAGETHTLGVTIPGMPMIAVGTNGTLAWGERGKEKLAIPVRVVAVNAVSIAPPPAGLRRTE